MRYTRPSPNPVLEKRLATLPFKICRPQGFIHPAVTPPLQGPARLCTTSSAMSPTSCLDKRLIPLSLTPQEAVHPALPRRVCTTSSAGDRVATKPIDKRVPSETNSMISSTRGQACRLQRKTNSMIFEEKNTHTPQRASGAECRVLLAD